MFGRVVRISFLISFAFLIYAFVDMYIQSNFYFENLLLLVLAVVSAICVLIWIYSMGLFIDKKNNILKIVVGFSKKDKIERSLSDVESIDVELCQDIGMNFIINYRHHCSEKIEYRFYRISFLEKSQYKRLKRQLSKIG
ncbi:MAG: hypothetical protein IKB75_06590 [Clostridia bacterium]|nr:hypothetical protein [Clostridia bacterium]